MQLHGPSAGGLVGARAAAPLRRRARIGLLAAGLTVALFCAYGPGESVLGAFWPGAQRALPGKPRVLPAQAIAMGGDGRPGPSVAELQQQIAELQQRDNVMAGEMEALSEKLHAVLQAENGAPAPHPLQEAWRAVDDALDRGHGKPETFAEYLARRNAAEARMAGYASGDTSEDTRDASVNTRDASGYARAGAPMGDISRSRKPNPFKNLVYPFTPNPSLWSYWLAYFGIAALLIAFGVSVLGMFEIQPADALMLSATDPVPLQSLAVPPAPSNVVG